MHHEIATDSSNFVPEPVDNFERSSANNPFIYPCRRPETSFVTDGNHIYELTTQVENNQLSMSVVEDQVETPVDAYLAAHGAAPMSERIPVLAYGANMNPASLKEKLGKTGRSDSMVVPTLYASLKGYDVVWSGGPGMNGNFIATLYESAETADTEVQVGVNFLTPEQVLQMHATELAYDLHTVTVTVMGQERQVYYYAGKDSVYTDESGRPIAVDAVTAQNRVLQSKDTQSMLDDALRLPGVAEGLLVDRPDAEPIRTAEDYVAFNQTLKKQPGTNQTPRLDFKKRMAGLLKATGRVTETSVTDQPAESWANVSTLHPFGQEISDEPLYRLPEMELPIHAWEDPARREAVLRAVRTHFHRHFPLQ